MPNENFLGAPTEGLGQTVTFAAGGSGSVPQASAGQRIQQRDEVQGGMGTNIKQAHLQESAPDPTMGVLFKMGAAILAPAIKAQQEIGFWRGAQQVASGQAVTEIVDEQPWYSKVFGTTDAVDGARAYSAFTKANDINVGIEVAMPELRKLSGPDFADHVRKQVNASQTGDAATDAMVFQQTSKTLTHQMVQQAKHHELWRQGELTKEQRGSMVSALTNLGVVSIKFANVETKATSPEDVQDITDAAEVSRATLETLSAFSRPEGQEPTVHSRNVVTALSAALAEGNLAGVYALQDVGVIASLELDDRLHYDKALQHAELKVAANTPEAMMQDIVDWQRAGEKGAMPDQILALRDAVNKKHVQLTGSRRPKLSVNEGAAELAQSERTRRQEEVRLEHERMRERERMLRDREAALTASEKDAQQALYISTGISSMQVGNDPKLSDKDWKEAWATMAKQPPGVVMATRVLQLNRNVDEVFRDALQTNIQAALVSGDALAMDKVYREQYLPLVTKAGNLREAVASQYVGKTYAKQMHRYHEMRLSDGDAPVAERARLALQIALQPEPESTSKSATKGLEEALRSRYGGVEVGMPHKLIAKAAEWAYDRVSNSDDIPMAPETRARLGEHVGGFLKDVPGDDIDGRLKGAVLLAKQRQGLEIAAGNFWFRPTNGSTLEQGLQRGDDKELRVNTNQINRAMSSSLRKRLTALGATGNPQIVQLPDDSSGLSFMVGGADGNGVIRWTGLSGSDIQKEWRDERWKELDEDIASLESQLQDAVKLSSSARGQAPVIQNLKDSINNKLRLKNQPIKY